MDDDIVDAFVIILPTKGCSWAKMSGCTMCGYINDACPSATSAHVISEFERVLRKYRGQSVVKIYTSGSFFDDNEVSPEVREHIYKALGKTVARLVVETRPEFVNEAAVEEAKAFGKLMIALGLESANNDVLRYSINKGCDTKAYLEAVQKIANHAELKTYVILKPPFLTEAEAIEDCIRSTKFAAQYSTVVSINPVNVQKNTLVEYLWKRREYRPPWLWSLLAVLEAVAKSQKHNGRNKCRIISVPTAAGSTRGVHNCGKCDNDVIRAVLEFSYSQDISKVERAIIKGCGCKQDWHTLLKYEKYIYTSVDVLKIL